MLLKEEKDADIDKASWKFSFVKEKYTWNILFSTSSLIWKELDTFYVDVLVIIISNFTTQSEKRDRFLNRILYSAFRPYLKNILENEIK